MMCVCSEPCCVCTVLYVYSEPRCVCTVNISLSDKKTIAQQQPGSSPEYTAPSRAASKIPGWSQR